MNAFIVERRLRTRESPPVVAQVDDERVIAVPSFPKSFEQQPDAAIEPADGFVVVGHVTAHFRQVRQVRRHDDLRRVVRRARDARPCARVAEILLRAMRIAVADDHSERLAGAPGDEVASLVRHECDVAVAGTLRRQLFVEWQRGVGKDVLLADERCAIPRGLEKLRQRANRGQQMLVVHVMREAVHPIRVGIQPGVDHRPTGAARRHRRECIREERAARGEPIEVRRSQDRIAVRAEIEPLIVGDDQQYVASVGHRGRGNTQQDQNQ